MSPSDFFCSQWLYLQISTWHAFCYVNRLSLIPGSQAGRKPFSHLLAMLWLRCFHSESPFLLSWEHLELDFSTVKHFILNLPGSSAQACLSAASEISVSTTRQAPQQPITSPKAACAIKSNPMEGQPGSLRTVRLDFPLASSE